jgi:hypothetical protein
MSGLLTLEKSEQIIEAYLRAAMLTSFLREESVTPKKEIIDNFIYFEGVRYPIKIKILYCRYEYAPACFELCCELKDENSLELKSFRDNRNSFSFDWKQYPYITHDLIVLQYITEKMQKDIADICKILVQLKKRKDSGYSAYPWNKNYYRNFLLDS